MSCYQKQSLDFKDYYENVVDSSSDLFNEVLNKNWRDNIGSVGFSHTDAVDNCPILSPITLNKTIHKLPNVILTHNLVVPPLSDLPVDPYINPYISNNNIEYVDHIKIENESIYKPTPTVVLDTVDNIFIEDTTKDAVVEEIPTVYSVDKKKIYHLKKIKRPRNNHKHINIHIHDCSTVNIERLLSN